MNQSPGFIYSTNMNLEEIDVQAAIVGLILTLLEDGEKGSQISRPRFAWAEQQKKKYLGEGEGNCGWMLP